MKIGTIIQWPSNTLPDGTILFAHGQAVSRTTYADLFSVIGTTYGAGDGSTTFNVPDYKGRVGVGLDSNDIDFDTLGETLGEKTHTLTVNEMPSHTHEQVLKVAGWSDPQEQWGVQTQVSSNMGSGNVEYTGGGQAHNIIQPSIVTNYIIKALNPDSIKISELESASSVTSSDVLPIVQNGETKKVTINTLFDDVNDLTTTLNTSTISETTTTDEVTLVNYTIPKAGLYLIAGYLYPNYYGASGRTIFVYIKKNSYISHYTANVINGSAYIVTQTINSVIEFNQGDTLTISIQNDTQNKSWAMGEGVINLVKLK